MVRISILQSAKIMTALYVVLGFVYTLIGIPMAIFGGADGTVRMIGIAYIFAPVFMGVFGFIFFVIFAAIYNALAASFGGFECEFRTIGGPGPAEARSV
jgi:hypothetical protein